MSTLFLAIPLTIFMLFVAPVWLWLHYSNRQRRGDFSSGDVQQLSRLRQDADRLRERVRALEAILDAEHPGWRQP
ncbi:envelope stress response membrane protein PspB [Pantoea sp. 1.19]|uniref:envelope stress response membrane protein PspB n=1 Tax=Pantoea sp. 1.19 TaxID=1925589 RepID=UPI0009489534|nr:envelope stress response membrane protein PspB [Pantoea sp. 1.19]